MWSDLMRRWMDLALWWVPGRNRGDAQSNSAAAENVQPTAQATPTPAAEKPAKPAKPAPSSAAGSSDELTGIKGIGPAMQKRLAAVGITSRGDLAAADPSALTVQLKAGKAVVSEAQVKAWVEAAAGRS